MFCNFSHVWGRNGYGSKFRMFVLDEKIRDSELSNKSNLLFQLTGMNPDQPETLPGLFACASHTSIEKIANTKLSNDISEVIIKNALIEDDN